MQKIQILRGAPGSGKTTYSKKLMENEPGKWKHINNDSLRASLDFSLYTKENEKFIFSVRKLIIKESLAQGYNVIIDNVNCGKQFGDTVKLCHSINGTFEISEKCFYEDLDVLVDRNTKRDAHSQIPDKIISEFWKALGGKHFKNYIPKTSLIENKIKYHGPKRQDEALDLAVICDLDGSISLFNKPGNHKVYDAHFRNPYLADTSNKDSLNEPLSEVIKLMEPNHKIIFVSGRKDCYETQTREFLETHFKNINYSLHMRKSDDNRPDDIIKKEIYHEFIENAYYVKIVFDDRDKMMKMWRSQLGLICYQVAEGNF